jgi:4-deoxy-L-threo-5-hexosulose-uronate ketol-isomerase
LEKVFIEDKITLRCTRVDRVVFGGAVPVNKELRLEGGKESASDTFLAHRETSLFETHPLCIPTTMNNPAMRL